MLVWRELFLFGMGAFGIGHLFFISAFGFQPLNIRWGIPLFISSMLGKIKKNSIANSSGEHNFKISSYILGL